MLDIAIEVKSEMKVGDSLEFNYAITSGINQQIKFISQIKCPNAPSAILETKEVDIKAGDIYRDKYFSMKVSELIEPQECSAIINIIEPFEQKQEEKFKIVANPSLNIEYFICRDDDCDDRTKVFKADENIFLNYETKVQHITSKAEMWSGTKKVSKIDLPGSLLLNIPGSYQIVFYSQADGYKDNTYSVPITVLSEDIKQNVETKCTIDGQCIPPENEQNCPQDCAISGGAVKFFKSNNLLFIAISTVLLFALSVISIIYYTKRKRAKFDRDDEKYTPDL